jgi:hypothetical protein
MRVEAVEKIVKRACRAGEPSSDAGSSLAIKSFLTAMDSDDSLLGATLGGPSTEGSEGVRAYAVDIALRFRRPELARDRRLYFLLSEKLIELLRNAGSGESLEAKLALTSTDQANASAGEHELWLQLTATGDTAEQATLRWGLGLAHVQQALLFTSRYLRQYLAQKGM